MLSRSPSVTLLFNAYIIPINTMMRNSMDTFLQGLAPTLRQSAFGPLHVPSVFPGTELCSWVVFFW